MVKGQSPDPGPKSEGHAGKVELGYEARDNYKARLTRGLLEVGLGEGPIVEILNFRTKRVLRRELFEDPREARDELARIREDIDLMTTEEFRRRYLQPPD
ncbi:MAG: hypothetical protein FJ313_06245 [Gemmatimonadetes bacterium]|nr:hypothetical protein [Gemmatimonadota bacterium]